MPSISLSRKRMLSIAVAALLCVIVLRETGLVNLNFYKSTLSTQFNASKSTKNAGGSGEKHSWDITIHNGDEAVFVHSFLHGNVVPIVVVGELDISEIRGNYFAPLLKRFEMTCRLEYTGADEMDRSSVDGKMEIEIAADIRGFCTRSEAKSLAVQKASECVVQYFNQQFQG